MSTRKRRSNRSVRRALRSPGRPPVSRRENLRLFWTAIAAGLTSERAAVVAGVSPPVGVRWFRENGGMPPTIFAPSAKPLSGRYLSFQEREEIALLLAQGPACVRSLTDWAVPPRQSHVRFDATRPRGAVGSFIAPQRRNGTLRDLLAGRRPPSWPSMLHYGVMFKIDWQALSPAQAERLFMDRQ